MMRKEEGEGRMLGLRRSNGQDSLHKFQTLKGREEFFLGKCKGFPHPNPLACWAMVYRRGATRLLLGPKYCVVPIFKDGSGSN